jgi:putative CocE/NonD family hydrolase
MHKLLCFVTLCVVLAPCAIAQQFDLPEGAVADSAALSKAMPELARQIMASYSDANRQKFLDQQFRLQIVAGQDADALSTMRALRNSLRADHATRAEWVNVQYEIYARARIKQIADKQPFNDAYTQSFRDILGHLDDRTSALVIRGLTMVDPSDTRQDLQSDLEKQKGKNSIALVDALKLIDDYQVEEAYRVFAELNPALIAEDDQRRYISEKDIAVKTPDGATVCALLMRPGVVSGKLTTLLNFTIYVDPNDNANNARQTASNGYAGVVGFTRGKACSPDKPVPYLHDGADAAALIDWITAQPWSDGRVGMFGGSYEGFTQWATLKHPPKALKAIMTGAPAAPGLDVPMEGNIFWNFIYPWPFYTTNAKGADDATYNDFKRWQKLNHDWYVNGRAYRDLDKIDGTPNPIFDEWISHPGYDAYWQQMIPYKNEFASSDIPALITIGYYVGGPGAGVYYFSQRQKYNPKAEHYLLIGPYDHIAAQYGVIGLVGNVYDSLGGLELDPVAKINVTDDIRYAWFDYVFKRGPKPALLQDKVNYQVVGANVWKHAPTLAAMANQKIRFHLSAVRSGNAYALSKRKPSAEASVDLKVDFADRSDVDRNVPGGGVQDSAVDTWNGLEFVSDPLTDPTELSGLFKGRLDFTCNKKDFDFEIDLYEQTPKGEYVQLAPFWTRASYAADLNQRHLLTPGKREILDFHSIRLMSRQLQQGSRVVAVLRIIKESGRQINYGTGKDVSDETIADAKEPLEISWYNDSYIDVPVGK